MSERSQYDSDESFKDAMKKHLEELRKQTDFTAMANESKEDSERFYKQILKEQWKDDSEVMTSERLESLLSSEDFGQKVVESIKRTNDLELFFEERQFGQEFGFVVFEDLGNGTQDLTPLFAGEERRINLFIQAENHERQFDRVSRRALAHHTHPGGIQNYFDRILKFPYFPESDYFSIADLKGFRQIAERENTSLIYGLGIMQRDERKGKLLLVSFNSFDKFLDFNPEAVVGKCNEQKRLEGTQTDISNIYREAGLNVARLRVDLRGDTPLNETAIKRASSTLTRRSEY